MHGIRSDTDNFLFAREPDFEAAGYISQFCDRDLLREISVQNLTSGTMEVLRRALDSKDIIDNYMVAGVGLVRPQDRDGIPQAADYLIRREGVDTVIVFGIVGEQVIDGSLRTLSKTLDPDKWLKDLLGSDTEGRFYGGGRHDKGGFQVPVGMFAFCDDRDLLWEVAEKTIKGLMRKRIGGPHDEKKGTGRKEKKKEGEP